MSATPSASSSPPHAATTPSVVTVRLSSAMSEPPLHDPLVQIMPLNVSVVVVLSATKLNPWVPGPTSPLVAPATEAMTL